MKQFLYLLILLASICVAGQTQKISPNVAYWKPSDFSKDITKAEVYEFKVKKGKVKKDSLLIASANLAGSTVSGTNYSLQCTTHVGCQRKFQEYKKVFSSSGQLLVSTYQAVDKDVKKDKYFINYDYFASETRYKYDDLGNKVEELDLYKQIKYSLDKKTKDTVVLYLRIQPSIESFVYNGTDLQSHYTQKDSIITRNKFLDIDTTEVFVTQQYQPRYKNIDNIYNENGKLSCWISYTRNGELHTKKYYYYDDKSRIVKQIDSTGWYFTTLNPYVETQILYDYIPSGLIKTVQKFENHFDKRSTTITRYNLKDLIISECRQYNDAEYCDCYDYTFDGDKIVAMIHTDYRGRKINSYFKYNPEGLMIEEKDVLNNKIVSLIRYYYK